MPAGPAKPAIPIPFDGSRMTVLPEQKHSWLARPSAGGADGRVAANHAEFMKRLAFYLSHGCDFMAEREFIYRQCLPLNGTLVEIGTGKGHFALCLARHGHRFISIDVNAADQDMARMNLRYYGWGSLADLRLADAERLPLADASVDAVVSVNVVHHLAQPVRAASEMLRVLKSTGKIVLSDFTEEGMALVNRCHTLEGKTHDSYRRQMDVLRSYFDERGIRHRTRRSRHEEVLVAFPSERIEHVI